MTSPTDRIDHSLKRCEDEHITHCGHIQPHGVLFVLSGALDAVNAVSSNLEQWTRVSRDDVFTHGLNAIFTDASCERLCQALAAEHLDSLVPLTLAWRADPSPRPCQAWLTSQDPFWYLDVVAPGTDTPDTAALFQRAVALLTQATSVGHACTLATTLIQQLTGMERVIVYAFDADWSGQVIAEALVGRLPAFLHLHFPASDIPPQARALYTQVHYRDVPDVHYQPVPIITHPSTTLSADTIDLGPSRLRSVSPFHLAYLERLGVRASFSHSIVIDGQLWGMIIGHHRVPHRIDMDKARVIDLIVHILKWQLVTLTEQRAQRSLETIAALRAHTGALVDPTTTLDDIFDALMPALVDLVGAQGWALWTPARVIAKGEHPPPSDIDAIAHWLADNGPPAELTPAPFVSHRLIAEFAPARAFTRHASGLLALPFGAAKRGMLMWFRGEDPRPITWAGRPQTPASQTPSGSSLLPRDSFEPVTEPVEGRAQPWPAHAPAVAQQVRQLLIDVVVEMILVRHESGTMLASLGRQLAQSASRLRSTTRTLRDHCRDDATARTPLDQLDVIAEALTALQDLLGKN